MRLLQHVAAGLALAAVLPAQAVSRLEPARWDELPGWGADEAAALWPALQTACAKPPAPWRGWCAQWRRLGPAPDALDWHAWLMQTLQPWRVSSARDGSEAGLLTGYFEPELETRRLPDERFQFALLDAQRRPLLYVEDAVDAVLLQVQGSGRVQITEADGRRHWRRLAWAGDNGRPFQSLGRWLVAQGAVRDGQASWRAIKAWVLHNPERLRELIAANPRVVYFREEALDDPARGPRGAQGLPLTPGRSVAVDPRALPYGALLWLDSPGLNRLVLAQDTGSVITGAVRADFFWGWGEQAFAQAARTHAPLRYWLLWPRGERPPG